MLVIATLPAVAGDTDYGEIAASHDGIGKVYMGREIAFTLGHRGVAWLERDERERSERPDLLVRNLTLEPDSVVADIGAGSGYFTFRIAPRVPQGKVLAVDVQPEMLDAIERRRDEAEASNVETVQGSTTDPGLPDGQVDAALIVDAYHEFTHPREMMEELFRDLRPGGTLYLVEYRAEDPDVPILPLHKMTEAQARREMAVVGFEWVETLDVLPRQHLMVFRRPEEAQKGRPSKK
jgi:ubiquinone/menaquinone biosynthesis C-methylase UbiE